MENCPDTTPSDERLAISQTVTRLTEPDALRVLSRSHSEGCPLPSGEALRRVVELARAVLFPGYYGEAARLCDATPWRVGSDVEELYALLRGQVEAGLTFDPPAGEPAGAGAPCQAEWRRQTKQRARAIALEVIRRLPQLRRVLATDVEAAYLGDPAATGYGEVISCYPCIKALTCYRLAHELHSLGVPLIPRIITERAHSETGIDIHPAARIGHHFTIDHGTGVVIGATCVIGNHVKLYQGVTLGAKSFPLDEQGHPIKHIPRHPILEDNVIVYAGATILGRITIGRGAVIGGNQWVTESVPPAVEA